MDLHVKPPQFLEDGTEPTGHHEYDALPRPIKDLHPYSSWAWLSETEKGRLIQTETEPEF